MALYGPGNRELQDRYKARKVADVIEGITTVSGFDEDTGFGYRAFVEDASYFFLATSGDDNTDCSFKGGPKGFVRIIDSSTLVFPDYDGNRMYKSLGNMIDNPDIGMLFMKFEKEDGRTLMRVRINGHATVHDDHPAKADYDGAKRIVEVRIKYIFLNCPRYIPEMKMISESAHIPVAGKDQPVPSWKERPEIKEALEGSE